MTDMDAFKLGENIGVSPGKVVFQNDLMQLIQYTPTTEKVLKRPLLIVPPWINKFYILDLRPRNSFVRWAVSQGHTVFVISWVNPDERLAEKGFEDYMTRGLSRRARRDRAGDRRARGQRHRLLPGRHAAGEHAGLYGGEEGRPDQVGDVLRHHDGLRRRPASSACSSTRSSCKALEEKMNKRGYLEGSEMATTFNMLRANDLIWSFVVNNYLLGNDPFPFDLLYWNARFHAHAGARCTASTCARCTRRTCWRSRAASAWPACRSTCGKIKTPAYFLSTREDHIAPWKSTYRGTQLLGGPKRFVLAASGHIAGVVNPPDGGKYSHWINTDLPPDAGGVVQGRHRDGRLLVAGLAALGHARSARSRCRRACRATAS